MGIRGQRKLTGMLAAALEEAERGKKPFVHPGDLYARVSSEDLKLFSAAGLADAAILAASEIKAQKRSEARITLIDAREPLANGEPLSILAITGPNRPFLYDSVMGEITTLVRDIHLAVHPIIVVPPKGDMFLFTHGDTSDPAHRISHIQIHMPRIQADAAEHIRTRMAFILEQVNLAVSDWKEMLAKVDEAAGSLSTVKPAKGATKTHEEARAFLAWLRDNNFTFLGMREYTYRRDKEGKGEVVRATREGLGILSDPEVRVLRLGKDQVTTTPEIIDFLEGPDFLIVTKANVRSVVHRRAYMDYIGIKRFAEDGTVIGELRVVGLFTSTAYTRSVATIPLLRSKVDTVLESFGYDPESHSGKLLLNTLESYPRDDLFQIDTGLLSRFCAQINDLSDRPRVRVLPRIDRFDRFVSVIVYVPRDQYDSIARERIGSYLKVAYQGRVSAFYPAFPEGGVARVHFIIGRSEGQTPRIPQDRLERDIRSLVTRWEDQFRLLGGDRAMIVSVSPSYKERFRPGDAVSDLDAILACGSGADTVRIAFYRPEGDSEDRLSLKIFSRGQPLSLSRRVPLLENLGFRVISEQTHDLEVANREGPVAAVILHDMELAHEDGRAVSLEKDGPRLTEAFLAIWHGETGNDGYNRLVTYAGLDADGTNILRAYARYLRQAGIAYSQEYMARCLTRHSEIAALLFTLFRDRFDPDLEMRARRKRNAKTKESIEAALSEVPSLDDDRILRRFANAVEATLRTSWFQRDDENRPRPAVAFKLDPKQLEGLPEPRPYREIFVYGQEVEGVHLRFGPVARGGLRWSDRAQDYRTEVLGLVKAQQVKNAVIVPVGAKGGFYPKKLPEGGSRDDIFQAGREAYKTFIRTLLSVTDNIGEDGIVPPAMTVRHDGDDPYFVVAADKGTATFSDTANALSQEAGFWLDDAFASGGSAGYDHKKMGITARGAWEAVKRHFREMDRDIQSEPFTVAGVGDMSGDVFGNGMLLSEQIRLVAAFDHRDIFIDPEPDTVKGFAERKRLFELPRSSWQDYDRNAMSKGGMVIPRSVKSVTLTPEAAAAIGLAGGPATPQDVMTAILSMNVDLLWFGGIGTYIKAEGENDSDVGDRANDPIRVTANQVRAKVVGEGANLGVTQKGRIAFASLGGRINSDAIDNSAGVNSSDVEVNIKIALASAMRDNRLTRAKRNTLLTAMTDEVADLVLRNNYLQTLAISLAQAEGVEGTGKLARQMSHLEARGLLNRKVETLPDDATVNERMAAGRGLTRPEIGVLLSYAKIVLFDEIVASSLPDDPYFESTLTGYFPARMRKGHARDIAGHRLRREIIATLLANEAINRGGPAFVTGLSEKSGATSPEIIRAFVLARDGLQLDAIYDSIDALDTKVPGSLQNELYALTGDALAAVTGWALKTGAASGDLGQAIAGLEKGIKELAPGLNDKMPQFLQGEAERLASSLAGRGTPAVLSARLAALGGLQMAPDILHIAQQSVTSPEKAADAFFRVTEVFRIGRIEAAAQRIGVSDPFEEMARARNLDEISAARRRMTISALALGKRNANPVTAWIEANRDRISQVQSQIGGLTDSGDLSVARLTVAAGLMIDLARSLSA